MRADILPAVPPPVSLEIPENGASGDLFKPIILRVQALPGDVADEVADRVREHWDDDERRLASTGRTQRKHAARKRKP